MDLLLTADIGISDTKISTGPVTVESDAVILVEDRWRSASCDEGRLG
jgi:hypothetical protein